MEARKLRGYVSNGMLAGPDELDFYERTDDVVYIDPDDAQPGDDFAEKFGLNDTLLDIENKSLTHRPDCFGVIGFAREVAGILGQPAGEWLNNFDAAGHYAEKIISKAELSFTGLTGESSNSLQLDSPNKSANDKVSLKATIVDPELCPRYQAVVLEGFKDDKPKYLTEQDLLLAKSGMRPIDPIVDVTNYLMLLTGQPLHAFDYDKLVEVGGKPEAEVIVRAAKKGEKLILLDGKEIEMAENDIVITSNNVPVALAGAMGGANTAIDRSTKRIVIESATFNLYNLRGTQFRHGIFSEAITRFTKGQPPALTEPVIKEAIIMLTENCGMRQAGAIEDAYPRKITNPTIDITLDQINNLLGTGFTVDQVKTTLENIDYKVGIIASNAKQSSACHPSKNLQSRTRSGIVSGSSKKEVVKDDTLSNWIPGQARNDEAVNFSVQAPFWRTDIHIPEDIIEDVGRINGYENIALALPKRDFTAVNLNPMIQLKDQVRETLASFGANEVLTYSFVHGDLLKKVGQDPANSYKIINSISPALQYYRQSLLPSLLEKTYLNIKVPFDNFALFEINKIHQKAYGMTDENVPVEKDKLGFVVADRKRTDAAYYLAKKYADELFKKLGLDVKYLPLENAHPTGELFEPKRAAQIKLDDNNYKECLGVIGELKSSVRRNLKLPEFVAGFELNLDRILELTRNVSAGYRPLATTEKTDRDLTLQVSSDKTFAEVENVVREILENLSENFIWELTPSGIFAPNEKLKNITFHLEIADREKTIDMKFVAKLMEKISKNATQKLAAKVI